MLIRSLAFSGVIELPVRTGRGYGIGCGFELRRIFRALRFDVGFRFDNHVRWHNCAFRADLALKLIAAHNVAEGEEDAGEKQHEEKQPNDVPAFQHAIPRASFSRSHTYFSMLPGKLTQLLMITAAWRNTIAVFFSIPAEAPFLLFLFAAVRATKMVQQLLRFRIVRRELQSTIQFLARQFGFLLLDIDSRE